MGLKTLSASSLPPSWRQIKDRLPNSGDSTYLFFIVDNDAATGQPWCPDVRAALPVVQRFFEQNDGLDVAFVSVGSKPAWKDPGNNWRKKWNINAVPTLVKYTLVQDGDGISQEQLVEEDAKDLEKLRAFVRSTNTYSL